MDFSISSKFNEALKRWDVTISGEVDIFSSESLKSCLLELINKNKVDLFLDCENLSFIDSTALGSLVAVLKNVKQYDGEIYLASLKPNIAKLFKITNLDKVFKIEVNKNVI